MALLHSVLSWLLKKRYHQIELFMKYPHEVQSEWFKRLISTAKDTEWGRKYDYKSINSYEDYRDRVPVNDYDSIKGDIDLLMKGKQNVLWPTDIRLFAKSSGTTSDKSKFIPVSKDALKECHFRGGKDVLVLLTDISRLERTIGIGDHRLFDLGLTVQAIEPIRL